MGIMLTHAGKEARTIYKTLPCSKPDDKMKFSKVLKAFRDNCQPCKNILYEQHRFWNLQQEEGGPVDAYNMRLITQDSNSRLTIVTMTEIAGQKQ